MTDAATTPQPLPLPSSADGWLAWLTQRCGQQLALARRGADDIRQASPGDAQVLTRWNDVNIALSNAFGAVSLFSQVHPDEAVRSGAEAAQQEAQKLATDLSLDRELYDRLASVDMESLDEDAARVLRLSLRDFTRAGVDLDEPSRARLRELAERENLLEQELSKNIRDDVRTLRLTTEQLAGLPADYLDAHPADDAGLHTITTDYPDVYPLITFATDPGVRRRMHVEFLTRAWPTNDEVLRELLTLRAEHAALLGYRSWADFDAEVKMIRTGTAIGEFIDRIAAAADASGRRDRDVLLERLRRDDPDAATIDRADATHYAELVRKESYAVDAQEIRTYLDFGKVRDGLLAVTGRLFGLEYAEVPSASTWHEDVTAYDVSLEGEPLGRIYLDLHPREGKYKHAAQFDLVRGIQGRQLPEGVLVCNFPRGLMEHRDVVTLFHEFGHLVHHVLAGRHRWVRFSGVATEWDFVEAPSQMLEEWAWHADVLATFASREDGAAMPPELVARMRAANDFGKGYLARTQTFYAALSYQFHRDVPAELDAAARELQATYDLFPFVAGTHFQASFGHLGGYASAYYTYLWSLVIAKDLLSAFDPDAMFDPEVARRYRDTVLAQGGRRDAADLVTQFLGRPYDFAAFTRWLEHG